MNGTSRYTATGLHHVLTQQGRKQRWLAAELGTSESAMSKIVHGYRTVGHERAEKIARTLNAPIHSIFGVPVSDSPYR